MQDLAGGDNNRTLVVFQSLDNCRIVVITKKVGPYSSQNSFD